MLAALLLVAVCSNASSQDSADGVLKSGVYSSSELGFRYAAPVAMRDTTASAKAQIEARAAALHCRSSLSVLLAMASGPDDTASDWHSVEIQTFARASWSDADDFHAESLMNAAVARGGLPVSLVNRLHFPVRTSSSRNSSCTRVRSQNTRLCTPLFAGASYFPSTSAATPLKK
jgi:hypothetical protein